MNERIKELAIQAGVYVGDDMWFADELNPKTQMFAQLIITDAINTVEKRFMGDLNREDMEVRRCVADLKQHFGVEE
jgi:hypothetical protein